MRTTTVAALAVLGLSTAVLAGAGAASAADAPTVPHRTRALAAEPLRQLREAVTAEASSTTGGAGVSTRSAVSAGGNLRVSGRDRYETAAEMSFLTWEPETAAVVFLASGTSLPDALAVGPSARDLGPVLLTERDRLPDATRAELQRLRPCLVVVVGGTPSVSDAVFADAEQYADPAGAGCPTVEAVPTVTR